MIPFDFDYRSLKALSSIVRLQSFEEGALWMGLTQSAISQRVKAMEELFGEPLLTRQKPYQLTPTGQKLINHYLKVKNLEDEIKSELELSGNGKLFSLSVNQDSLEGWLLPFLMSPHRLNGYNIELINDDQENTLEYLKQGLVTASISSKNTKIKGCDVVRLGFMTYSIVCTPQFKNHFFPNRVDMESLIKAPSILFNRNDNLHTNLIEVRFKILKQDLNCSYIPSVNGFYQATLAGMGYSCLQNCIIDEDLKTGRLLLLDQKLTFKMPLYLHYYSIPSKSINELIEFIREVAKKNLY